MIFSFMSGMPEQGPQGPMRERIDRSKTRFDLSIALLTTSSVPEVKASALLVKQMRARNQLAVIYGDATVTEPPTTFQLIERASLAFIPPVEGVHPIGDTEMSYLPTIFVNMNGIDHIDISEPDTQAAIKADAQALAIDLAATNELAVAFGNGSYTDRVTTIVQRGLQNQAHYLHSLDIPIGGNTDPRTMQGNPERMQRLIERRIGRVPYITDMSLQDVQVIARDILTHLTATLGILGNFDMQAVEQRLRVLLFDPAQLQHEGITEQDVKNHFLVLRACHQPMIMRQRISAVTGIDLTTYITMNETRRKQAEEQSMNIFRRTPTEDRVLFAARDLIFEIIYEFRK